MEDEATTEEKPAGKLGWVREHATEITAAVYENIETLKGMKGLDNDAYKAVIEVLNDMTDEQIAIVGTTLDYIGALNHAAEQQAAEQAMMMRLRDEMQKPKLVVPGQGA